MLEAVIRFLIWLCVIVLCVVVFLWVLGMLGIVIPPKVMTILYVIAALIALLFLVRLLRPYWNNYLP